MQYFFCENASISKKIYQILLFVLFLWKKPRILILIGTLNMYVNDYANIKNDRSKI